MRLGIALVVSVLLAVGIHVWDVGAIAGIELLEPRWLLLVAVAPALFLVRTLSLTDLSVAQQLVQAVARTLVVAALAIALARPVRVTEHRRVATVALVDVSDSISDAQLAEARRFVDELRVAGQSVQVVTFAEQPRVAEAIARHAGAGAGTDVQAAMQLAYGLFPDGYVPRIVIVSDGNQTAGDVAVEAYRAQELGVRVSWRTFAGPAVPEVRVVGLAVPDELRLGQPYDVTAELWSSSEQDVTIALEQDGFPNGLEPRRTVHLREGTTHVKLRSEARHGGAIAYRLSLVHVERDTERANNAAVMTAAVQGRPRVLYVEGSAQRVPGSAGYFARALEHENIDVTVRGPQGLPATAQELAPFDLVVVSDVPAQLVGAGKTAALDRYVTDGGGLLVAGGEDSLGAGGYEATALERMLPVRLGPFGYRVHPDIAIVLAIDRSSSMAGPRIEAAKASALATAEALQLDDMISVVAFDSTASVIVGPVRAANRALIARSIAHLGSGGGTDIRNALARSFELLRDTRATIKHVILLTDGAAAAEGIRELVEEMATRRITVSCIGVQQAQRSLLETIVEAGHGRLVMVDNLRELPRFVVKETHDAQRSQLVEDEIHVHVAKRVEAIEGTGVEHAPPLRGYVMTRPKARAETILISNIGEPILARWRYGAGTSVAWTSDVKNRWSADWIRWAGYPKFWAQVVRSAMRHKAYGSYELSARVVDGRARVTVDAIGSDDTFVNGLDGTLELVEPSTHRTLRTLPMQQTAAGRYTAELPIERYGSYLVKATHRREGAIVAESFGSVTLSYPLEYARVRPDVEALRHAARVSGGIDEAPAARLVDPGGESVRAHEELWPYVLLAGVALFLLDLFAKRVRLFGYRRRA